MSLKVIQIAKTQDGYLEKATNAQLDHFTANAGTGNWTKYARDLDNLGIYNGKKNGYAWCDVFVDWCFITAYGEALGLQITFQPKGGYGAGCTGSAQYYKNNKAFGKTAKAGAQIFFSKDAGKTCYHTGLVIDVRDGRVYTIEGNTSSLPGVVENGGCVRMKSYALSYSYIAGYGYPDYGKVQTIEEGELDMDEATLRKIIREEIATDKQSDFYRTYPDVPDIYKPAIMWLHDLGLLNGTNGGADGNILTFEDNDLVVDNTFCRLAYIVYNAKQKGLV